MSVDFDDLESVGMGPECPECGCGTSWVSCWQCFGDGGRDGEDLMAEDPLWYDENDWEPCDVCEEQGGWWYCTECKKIVKAVDG